MRNQLLTVAVTVLFLLCPALSGLAQQETKESDAKPKEIVINSTLLKKYQEISELDQDSRREMFIQASPEIKSGFAGLHLALYLAKHPELNQEQTSVILSALEMLTTDLYAGENMTSAQSTKRAEALRVLQVRALKAFPRLEAGLVFAGIGGDGKEVLLLKSYLSIASRSEGSRKIVFSNLSPKEKSDLWRTHLALALAKGASLTKAQQELIAEAMALVTEAAYANEQTKPESLVQSLTKRLLGAFNKKEGAAIFVDLGSFAATNDPEPEAAGNCKCSKVSDWCIYDCYGSNCTKTSWGCGTLGAYACDSTQR